MKQSPRARNKPFGDLLPRLAPILVAAIFGFGLAVPLQVGLLHKDATASADPTPEYIPGTYFTISCAHSSVKMGTTTICHDGGWGPTIVCGGGTYCTFTFTETMDAGYVLNHWGSQGAACIGTQPTCSGLSTSSSISVWTYGPSASKSAGSLGVNVPGHPPGCSSYSTITISTPTVTGGAGTNPANVYATLAWTVSNAGGTTYVEWGGSGPLSGYQAGYTSFTSTSTSQSYTIWGMRPGMTMYYSVDAEPKFGTCYIGGVATGSFTSPAGSTSNHLYGYVYDGSSGSAFSGAHVVAYTGCKNSGGTWSSTATLSVTTASDGSYDLPASFTCASGTTWGGIINWSSYASGYWRTEFTPSSPITTFDGVDNWQFFALNQQTLSYVWTGLAFVNGGADAACSITSSYTMAATVTALAGGNGGSLSDSYSTSSTINGASGNGLATYDAYENNGVLDVSWDGTSYTPTSAWLFGTLVSTGSATFTSTSPTMPSDYLSGAPSGTPTISLAATTTKAFSVTIANTATLQLGVQASLTISVGFLGIVSVGASVPLQLTWSESTTVSNGITCTLGHSTSTGTEKFQVYVEDSSTSITGYNGLVVHIWQL